MTDSMNPAVEGLFDPEATTDALLATVKENISKKVTSVDQAADLENRLSEEAAEFNQMLSTISTAMRQCEAGEISKEEALAAAAPCVKALKERCSALQLADVNVKDEDITEGEIAMLREYIVGVKDIIAARKKELQDCALTNNEANAEATEGVLSSIAGMSIAQEGLFDPKLLKTIRNGSDAKNAALLYKNAKKLYSMGSKEKAKDYMQKAKEKYQKCLDEAKKAGKEKKVLSAAIKIDRKNDAININSEHSKKAYSSTNAYQVVAYFEDRVDTCEAYLRQWANKAGNKDLKETKAQLKEERKAEKARIREEKKAAKAKAAAESALIEDEITALESLMDSYELNLALEAAMEAEGSEVPASKASEIGSKLRSGFGKLKDAFKKGDKAAADAANAEIKAAADELSTAADSADEEGKKKLSTAAKIGIAAAAAVVLLIGDVVIGQALRKHAEKSGNMTDIKGVSALIIKSSNTIVNKIAKAGSFIANKKVDSAAKKLAAGPNPNKNLISNANKAKEFASKADNLANATAQSTKDIKFGANSRKIAKQSAGATVDTSTPSGIKKALNRMSVILGRWNTTDSKVAALKKKVANLENVVNDLNAKGNPNGALVYAEEIGKLNAEINALLGKAPESYTAFEGAGFLGYLAMEEANFSDEVALVEIENENGRGFSDEAEGDNLIEDAVIGVETEDDECDEEECEESVLESALAIFKLEDGLDPDED